MRIGIFGTGAYGMALSSILVDNRHQVTMWSKHKEEYNNLLKTRKNEKRIPGFTLSDKIELTMDIEDCIEGKDLIIIAIPAAYVSELVQQMSPYITNEHILIATKGIEQGTGLFINQILEKYLSTKNIAVISGPSFAVDLVTKMPAGLSVASNQPETILLAKQALQNEYIKLRDSKDIIGVEICGSLKNVIAMAAGMLEGMKANESTKAMLITEAVHDMEQILDAFNCNKRTVLSFAGLGDLLLTCNTSKSRNYSFGITLGSGASKEEIKKYLANNTVEGYYTLESIYQVLKDKQVSIPIIDMIYEIVVNEKSPELLLMFLVIKS